MVQLLLLVEVADDSSSSSELFDDMRTKELKGWGGQKNASRRLVSTAIFAVDASTRQFFHKL